MPSTSASRVIRASQHDIWAVLSDIEHAGRWNRAWTRIDFTSTLRAGRGTRFRAHMEGTDDVFEFEVCDWDAPQRIAFCPVRHPAERYPIELDSHAFEVHEISDTESEVTITANASTHGLKAKFIATFFWSGHQREGLNLALDALQSVFEPDLIDSAHGAALEPTSEE